MWWWRQGQGSRRASPPASLIPVFGRQGERHSLLHVGGRRQERARPPLLLGAQSGRNVLEQASHAASGLSKQGRPASDTPLLGVVPPSMRSSPPAPGLARRERERSRPSTDSCFGSLIHSHIQPQLCNLMKQRGFPCSSSLQLTPAPAGRPARRRSCSSAARWAAVRPQTRGQCAPGTWRTALRGRAGAAAARRCVRGSRGPGGLARTPRQSLQHYKL